VAKVGDFCPGAFFSVSLPYWHLYIRRFPLCPLLLPSPLSKSISVSPSRSVHFTELSSAPHIFNSLSSPGAKSPLSPSYLHLSGPSFSLTCRLSDRCHLSVTPRFPNPCHRSNQTIQCPTLSMDPPRCYWQISSLILSSPSLEFFFLQPCPLNSLQWLSTLISHAGNSPTPLGCQKRSQ